MLIYNCIVNFLFQAGLGGHMLGIADEDGWVQILDSRRAGSRSLIKGMHDRYIIYCTHYLDSIFQLAKTILDNSQHHVEMCTWLWGQVKLPT